VKRLILLIIGALIITGIQFLVNCSNPLDTANRFNPAPPGPTDGLDTLYDTDTIIVIDTNSYTDTIYVLDTLIIYDTSLFVDTIYNSDTIVVFDTVLTVDTVIVIEPDPNGSQIICSRIACNQKEIIWMFRNPEGIYHLEFVAAVESDDPSQRLTVHIGNQAYTWKPSGNPEMIMDLHLDPNTTIFIESSKPPAYGHSIDICLTINPL
jgi:hypothetical protein